MSSSKIFLFSCLAFIAGIGVSSLFPPQIFSADFLFFVYVLLLGFIFTLIFGWQKKKLKFILFLLIFFVLGFWRYQISWLKTVEGQIESYFDQKITFSGVVAQEPDERIDSQRLVIRVSEAEGKAANGEILVTASVYPQHNYGDRLRISCKIKKPQNFNDFDYGQYLAVFDIYAICGFPQIEVLEKNQGGKFYQEIFAFKKKLRQVTVENLAEPPAGFLIAFLLGDKKSLDQTLFNNFAKSGLAHIIAISGQHITIISVLLLSFFISLGFWRKQAFYLISFCLISYVIIIGAPASAVRAAIMGFLLLFAMHLGRLNSADRALSLAAALMLAFNPKLILEAGFQLSFAATMGIVYFYPFFRERLRKVSSFWGLRDLVLITLAAQIAVLPLSLYYFKRLPLFSILANFLVLPILPLVISLGFAALFIGLIYPALAKILFWFLWLILIYIIKVAEYSVKLPLSYFEFQRVSWWWAGGGYFVIIGIIIKFKTQKEKSPLEADPSLAEKV
ncbi:MAG: ComEC/Rec2 family competence protein [bacterium]